MAKSIEIGTLQVGLTEEQMEKIELYCSKKPDEKVYVTTSVGRPVKPLPENFKSVYYEWVFGMINLNQAIQMVGLSKETFYKRLKEQGLYKKTEVEVKMGVNEVLQGIDGNGLVLTKEMTILDAFEIIKKAIAYAEPKPHWVDNGECFKESVCAYVLMKINNGRWEGRQTSAICEVLGFHRNTYDIYIYKEGFKGFCEKVMRSIRVC